MVQDEPAPQPKEAWFSDGQSASNDSTGTASPMASPRPRQGIPRKSYDVRDFYKTVGPSQALARTSIFENVTLVIIIFNGFWIGYDSDSNMADMIQDAEIHFQYAESFFCVFFTLELGTRLLAFEFKRNWCQDFWVKFDSVLVFFMIFETWILPNLGGSGLPIDISMLRLLRLLRLTRLTRVVRQFPELMVLIKGMVNAGRSVSSTLILLMALMYIYAIGCTIMFADKVSSGNYSTVAMSMYTLFMGGTLCDDITAFLGELRDEVGVSGVLIFCVYVLLSSFTVLNMLIGVLCEVISETTQDEEEKAVTMQITEELEKVFSEIDKDGNYLVSQSEFRAMVKNERVLEAFKQIEVEKEHLLALCDTLFEQPESAQDVKKRVTDQQKRSRSTARSMAQPAGSGMAGGGSGKFEQLSGSPGKRFSVRAHKEQVELTFDEFVQSVVHMRPKNPASVMHIAELKQMLRAMTKGVELQLDEVIKQFPEYDDPDDEFIRLSKEVEGTFRECFDILDKTQPVVSPRLPAVESIAEPNIGRGSTKTPTQESENMNLDEPSPTYPGRSPPHSP